ncbi:MAG: response regulator transcription factor [Chloroflexota bacterium]|nr:response regulator transcription factor [Chloroflexota bacterium]
MTAEKCIRIVLADDHDMVRKGLRALLEQYQDLEIVGEAKDGQAVVDVCRRFQPDVLLLDMLMPRQNGIDALPALRQHCPDMNILALTSFDDADTVQQAIKGGAIGYLMKNVSGNELATAIRKAQMGQSTLSPEAAQVLIRATTQPLQIGHDLTERERGVLALMKEGLNNRQIAERLVISSSTVKNHVSSILSKLSTVSRTQAVAVAVEHNLVP